MSYSQRNEEQHILSYFPTNKGTFLDVGAYNPFKFSTTRALYERGWKGAFIEPSDACRKSLTDEYEKDKEIEIYDVCLGAKTQNVKFWDSNGDALSSTDPHHVQKWTKNYGSKFTEKTVNMISVEQFMGITRFEHFNFINIDVENDSLAVEILKSFDLSDTQMVCIEVSNLLRPAVLQWTGWRNIYESPENIIVAR